MMDDNEMFQQLRWICGIVLILCLGCAPIASRSSPTLTQDITPSTTMQINPSTTTQITATPTEESLTVSAPTATQTQQIILSPTAQTPTKPTDAALEVLIHDADTRTGLGEVDQIIDIVLAGDINRFRQKIEFVSLACTHVMALGGPPACREAESEGALVEVLPFLGPGEGSHLRRDELDNWQGIDVAGLYAVYQVSDRAYSSKDFPTGEYGIVFRTKDSQEIVTLQIKNGSILRIDFLFGTPPDLNFENDAQELILPLPNIKECPGAPPQNVMVGEKASVCTQSEDLIVREEPGRDGRVLTGIEPGTNFMIIDGPSCFNNWSWWKIELDSGIDGWVAEGGDDVDPYFICPVD